MSRLPPVAPVPLNVLLLEDNPDDADLLVLELNKTGYAARVQIVDSREEFASKLTPEIDLVISDHALPQFNAHEALSLLQDRGLDAPFIIVSGAISEDAAIDAMRRGAADYLLKDRPARLGEAIRGALRERDSRREKEQALDAIRQSEALNRTVLASLSAHIAVIADDGRILTVNGAWEVFGLGSGNSTLERASVGTNYLGLCRRAAQAGDTVSQEALAGIEGVLAHRHDQFSMEYSCGSPEQIRWFEMRVTPLVSSQHGGAVIAHTDITTRKQYEQQLIETKEAAEEMASLKSAFLANMSHEIRTPLTAVLGFSEILMHELSGEHQELVSLIIEGGRRLKDTLTSVLELSQLQGGKVELSRKPVDVTTLIENTAGQFTVEAHDKGLTIDTSGVERPLSIQGDRVALERVLSNLVGNAIKFTERGSVAVSAHREETEVAITVSDTGIGIDAAYLPHLFDEFRQESSGMGRSYEGVGLGLAITKRLVELMGGSIAVESRKGAGSSFTLRIPAEAPSPRKGSGRPSVRTVAERRRVLVVEDNQMTLTLLHMLLKEVHEATFATTPEQALAAPGPYDVVLLDINLGAEISGMELLPLLKRGDACRGAYFVAMTAYALPGDREQFLAAGFDCYVAKPFSPADIMEAIATAI